MDDRCWVTVVPELAVCAKHRVWHQALEPVAEALPAGREPALR
jgi:hypothetical protein